MGSVADSHAAPSRPALWPRFGGAGLGLGLVTAYLSVIVLIPLAALVAKSTDAGAGSFWTAITNPEGLAALKLVLISSAIVVVINAVMGTTIAWVLVRDEFPGKRFVNSVIDLPFALPTIVAGLTLLALYGEDSPVGIHIAYTRTAVVCALLFVTLPFVVRAVQPVLLELDQEMEEAAASLGASNRRIFRSVVLPNLAPAMIAGCALAFARAIGEFGSLVLLTGNIPFHTQAASVYIYGRIQTNDPAGAASVSVLLLFIAVGLLFSLNLFSRWRSRHERA